MHLGKDAVRDAQAHHVPGRQGEMVRRGWDQGRLPSRPPAAGWPPQAGHKCSSAANRPEAGRQLHPQALQERPLTAQADAVVLVLERRRRQAGRMVLQVLAHRCRGGGVGGWRARGGWVGGHGSDGLRGRGELERLMSAPQVASYGSTSTPYCCSRSTR